MLGHSSLEWFGGLGNESRWDGFVPTAIRCTWEGILSLISSRDTTGMESTSCSTTFMPSWQYCHTGCCVEICGFTPKSALE
eukprot:2829051-Amphidinium_carterae.1